MIYAPVPAERGLSADVIVLCLSEHKQPDKLWAVL